MSRDGGLYCDSCLLFIADQKHVTVKKPGTRGEANEDYLHYHNRHPRDCWGQRVQQLVGKYSGRVC
jgi:hypothetical protein